MTRFLPTRMRRLCSVLAIVCAAHLIYPHKSPGQDIDALTAARLLEQAFVDAVERAERSVVAIARVTAPQTTRPGAVLDPFQRITNPDPRDPEFIPQSFGSGVVIEYPEQPGERFVLTTYHVAMGSLDPEAEDPTAGVKLYVTLPGRTVVDAEVVAAQLKQVEGRIEAAYPYVDLAVLRLDLEGAGLLPEQVPALKRGDADNLQKGRLVLALGNPYAQARDGSASVSMGMISNISRRPEPPGQDGVISDSDATLHSFGTLLHVDTRLDLGVSGGALINLDGELIGITTALAALQGYEKSVGYAIPLDRGTWRIVRDMLNGWEPDLGFMGIAPRTLTRREMRLDGYDSQPDEDSGVPRPSAVQVSLVSQDSPAWQAGLQQNDVILDVNGQPVYDAPDLMRTVALLGADTVARVRIWRPQTDQSSVVDVRLGKWPVGDDSAVIASHRRYDPWQGLSVDYPTARRRYLPSDILATRYPQAVVITNVASDSPAAAASLSAGQFIQRVGNRNVQTPAEFYAAVAEATGQVELTLLNGERRTIQVP